MTLAFLEIGYRFVDKGALSDRRQRRVVGNLSERLRLSALTVAIQRALLLPLKALYAICNRFISSSDFTALFFSPAAKVHRITGIRRLERYHGVCD